MKAQLSLGPNELSDYQLKNRPNVIRSKFSVPCQKRGLDDCEDLRIVISVLSPEKKKDRKKLVSSDSIISLFGVSLFLSLYQTWYHKMD